MPRRGRLGGGTVREIGRVEVVELRKERGVEDEEAEDMYSEAKDFNELH